MNRFLKVCFVVCVAFCIMVSPFSAQAQGGETTELAPLFISGNNIIPNQYIVVLKSSTEVQAQSAVIQSMKAMGGQILFEYGTALQGFAVVLSDPALAELRTNPLVDYIEADQMVSLDPMVDSGSNVDLPAAEGNDISIATVQTPATWGLDRIDQRNLPLNNSYSYQTTASAVNVYILDTGIRSTHTQFGGRATRDYDTVGDGQNGNDCHGHGTHVAGTIGGSTYGVAKAARIHAVRVLGCNGAGSYTGIIAAVDWVASHRVKPAVANMSLGGGYSAALNSAITSAIGAGVTFVVAAGNNNANACNYSPASTPAAITVGSTTSTDARSYFSNWGTCLDIFAPGSDITSSWIGSDTATNTISGTSMATPHAVGVAALYLAANPTASPASVASALISYSTKNKVTDPAGSVNQLLYSLVAVAQTVPYPIAPSGTISDTTPTYSWGKVSGATQYRYQLYKGTTSVYTKTVLLSACGTTANCVNTPTTVLAAGSYKWMVRAYMGGVWKPFSAYKLFTISLVPVPVAPSGSITDTTPAYSWKKVNAATKYQYQLYKGTTHVYTRTVLSSACGTTANCVTTPTTVLTAGSYKWKVQAYIGGAWKPYSAYKTFSLIPAAAGFNSPFTSNASGWAPVNGSWSVIGGNYRSPGLSSYSVSSAHASNYPTFTYTVRMKRTGCVYCANVINFRSVPKPVNSYGFWNTGLQVAYDNYGEFYLGYLQNGNFSFLIPWTYSSYLTSGWNVLKITMNGNYLQGFINGSRVFYGTTNGVLSTGQVGVGYYRDTSSGNMLYVDYATLVTSAPASSLGSNLEDQGGINLDQLGPVDSAAADPRENHP